MPLTRCLKEVTEREYRIWQEWFDQEWNEPDRTDHYLMYIACEVRRVLDKHPGRIQPKDFRITFKREEDEPKEPSKEHLENMAAIAKAKWFAATGFKGKK